MPASGGQALAMTETLDQAISLGYLVTDLEGANELRGAYRRHCQTSGTAYIEAAEDRDDDCWRITTEMAEGHPMTVAQREAVERLSQRLGLDVDETRELTVTQADAATARALADGLALVMVRRMRPAPDDERLQGI
jgi:hypothetical protein